MMDKAQMKLAAQVFASVIDLITFCIGPGLVAIGSWAATVGVGGYSETQRTMIDIGFAASGIAAVVSAFRMWMRRSPLLQKLELPMVESRDLPRVITIEESLRKDPPT